MLPRTRFYTSLLAALTVAVATAQGAGDAAAQAPTGVTYVVRVNASTGAEPGTLSGKVGDSVVWWNGVATVPMAVIFEDRTPVKVACGAPVGFHLGSDGAYASGLIPPGGMASLCFVRAGAYRYRVIGSQGDRSISAAGTVVMQ